MHLVTLGISHHTAPVQIRERLAFTAEMMPTALISLKKSIPVTEAVVLSTCNRTEIYCAPITEAASVMDWWRDYQQLQATDIQPYVYLHRDAAAVTHMMRVASGLDSQVLGESEIFGQMKAAYSCAEAAGLLGKRLHRLFQKTFAVAKQVRTETELGLRPVSIAYAAVGMAKHLFSDLRKARVLLLGAGETMELAAQHLHQQGVQHMVVMNRTLVRAETLAARYQATALPLSELSAALAVADIVMSATASAQPMILEAQVRDIMVRRRHRPLLLIDLAVPRNVEPGVGNIEDVYLYTVDSLTQMVEKNKAQRQSAAQEAETIIATQTSQYMAWWSAQDAMGLVKHYRKKVEKQRDHALEQALLAIQQGKSPEAVIRWLANDLCHKWMHAPTVQLRHAIFEKNELMLEALQTILNIND